MNEEGALRVVHDEIVVPGAPWSARVRRDQVLRIVDLEDEQGIDFLCYDAADPRERYYAPNTIKKSGTLRLTNGHALYSYRGRPLITTLAVITTPSPVAAAHPATPCSTAWKECWVAARTSWPPWRNTAGDGQTSRST